MKNLIYVASPYRGDAKKNIAYAKNCCNFVLNQGCNFYCPHLILPVFLDDTKAEERELALTLGKEMLARCDLLYVFGEVITEGMRAEMDYAEECGIPIIGISSTLVEEYSQDFGHCLC